MTVLQPVAHWPKIDHAQAAGVWKTVAANLNLIFITIGAFKYPILIIIASPIVADSQYVVYKYFTQMINVTDILLQFFLGRILYSLDYSPCVARVKIQVGPSANSALISYPTLRL